ncbi:low molecular weight phosphotyrosine protein phosphatase [Defluviimonas sp. WL0002]|uniref:protein-tyrosine-phosphatase n=1 Tax=Albidovulum marisflavi TaxID=2984159 RepID=A0ABT2ZES5_9RHOB|nr:low molecular weight protein-tyrosine-phosphatase [Defluviimonas sp. WL0002]MCV2869645.1 low molecular weight phosphotyrosine protein phosphatase [Defluviimonas sp. WL0002]
MTLNAIFVCLGNICRSPAAEAVVRAKAHERGVAVSLDSAGTGDWHVGQPPYPPMIRAAALRGYDLAPLRARQFLAQDFGRFDVVLVMDRANQQAVEALRPKGNQTPVRLFLDHAPGCGATEVPDPYFTRDFDAALDLIERAADGFLDRIASQP